MSISSETRGRAHCRRIGLLIALAMAGAGHAADVRPTQEAAPRCVHPSNTMMAEVVGIDVSRWQGKIHFDRFPRYIKYVFVKATQGLKEVDPQYSGNVERARAAGLTVGSYHFFVPDDDGISQFRHFIVNASIKPGDLPPVIDIEAVQKNPRTELVVELKRFLALLESHYGGKPIIYSGRDYASHYLRGLGEHPLWLAEYTASPKPVLPPDWKDWTFWQNSQRGAIDGIEGCVDLDTFNGDGARFAALLLKSTRIGAFAPVP